MTDDPGLGSAPDLDDDVHDPADEDDGPGELTNGDLARIFHDIGDMLEVKGELVFKTVAYHRAADAIGRSPVDLVSAYRAGEPPKIPGVGKAISDKILELATTGQMALLRPAPRGGPAQPRRAVADPGPRAARPSARSTPSSVSRRSTTCARQPRRAACAACADCRRRPNSSSSRGSPGSSRRRTDAPPPRRGDPADGLIDALTDDARRPVDRARRLVPASPESDRRPRPPRRDGRRPGPDRALHLARCRRPRRQQGRLQGGGPAAARPAGRPDGHATGRRRARTASTSPGPRSTTSGSASAARDQGWSLSEKGFLRIGEDGEPLTGDAAELRTFATEDEAYAFLGLPFIEPELREDRRRDRGGPGRPPAPADRPRRPARRPAQPLRLVRRDALHRGHGRVRPPARPRLPGPDRPHPVAGHRPRPRPPTGSRSSG